MIYHINSISGYDNIVVINPFPIMVRKVWCRYRADFEEANLCEFGDESGEAFSLLLDVIASEFEDLTKHKDKLGSDLATYLSILEKYLKLK